jgi:hypothetical protein
VAGRSRLFFTQEIPFPGTGTVPEAGHALYSYRYAQALLERVSYMDKEIERQIEEISSSAIEFRKSIDGITFGRLKDFFWKKGKEVSRDSKLKDLLGSNFSPSDWYELEDIGLRIPALKRHRAFHYVTVVYILVALITWAVIFLTKLETIFIVWGLPIGIIGSVMFTLTFTPILGFMTIFKQILLPVDTVDKLVDGVIAKNWARLLVDDKKLFKEILEQELTGGGRASA